MRDTLVESIQNVYITFIEGIITCVDVLTSDIATVFPFITSTMSGVEGAIKGFALSILTIMAMLEVIGILQKMDDVRMEDAIKIAITLCMARITLDWTPTILGGLYWKISQLIELVASVDTSATEAVIDLIKTEIDDSFPKGSGIIKTIGQLGTWATYLPNFLLMFVSYVVVQAMAYGRMIEVTLLTHVSYLPMSFMPFSGTRDIPKRFLLNFIAVCLQGLIILVCFKIYLGLLASCDGVMQMTVMTVVLLMSVVKSSGWAKEMVGMG